MNLVLIGYRGSGKTTAGAALADRLKLCFVDSDEAIVKRAGKSIEHIFSQEGEPAFRALERAVLLDLLAGSGLVPATGGGAVLDPEVHAAMKAHAVVFALCGSGNAGRSYPWHGPPIPDRGGSL